MSKVIDTLLTISILNTRALKKHIDDLLLEKHLFHNGIVYPTKTQLKLSDDTTHLKGKLQPYFSMKIHSNAGKYKNIAID